MDFLIQRARRAGRTVTIADGDRKKPTLAGLYPPAEPGGALQPRGKDIGDVMEWVTEITSQTAAAQVSMVLDMGAGDDVLELHGKDLNLREFCVASGVDPLAIYSIGPEVDDFDYVIGVYEDGYFRFEYAQRLRGAGLRQVSVWLSDAEYELGKGLGARVKEALGEDSSIADRARQRRAA